MQLIIHLVFLLKFKETPFNYYFIPIIYSILLLFICSFTSSPINFDDDKIETLLIIMNNQCINFKTYSPNTK